MLVEYVTGGTFRSFRFPLPPDMDFPEVVVPKQKTVESISGHRQVTHYSNITTLFQRFSLLPLDFVNGDLKTFFVSHALLGRTFVYYLDPDDLTQSDTWELDDRVFEPKKNESSIDRYDIEFTLRRI